MMREQTTMVESKFFYLSFCDASRPAGTQFLGACIVRASHLMEAVQVAHLLGINPGGEVLGYPIPVFFLTAARAVDYPIEKLLTRPELEELDAKILAFQTQGEELSNDRPS